MPRPARPRVMGIVNVTPDSFSDGGRYLDRDAAVARGRALLADGADLLDIGGESTRPGAASVSTETQVGRVVPVIEGLRGATISVDTCDAIVADRALEAGATIVNDVSGGLADPDLLRVVARRDATVILGHTRGTPSTMNDLAVYDDVLAEVLTELKARVDAAIAAGIARQKIWVDPGIGFAKTAAQNIALLGNLDVFRIFELPIVVGASRKRFLGGETSEREEATAAVDAIAIWNGADVIRVHDVARQRRSIELATALANARR